ncbi:MAG TPA: hypothetical protein PLT58_05280 [Atribacterota bacterium]|nr:hypothetical protein [Atribacterota bacterium]HOR42651.1 hypothetical protein [Atribacterota bacterium]HPK87423.1 hypothetical protein [Atribacterota bacterium]
MFYKDKNKMLAIKYVVATLAQRAISQRQREESSWFLLNTR